MAMGKLSFISKYFNDFKLELLCSIELNNNCNWLIVNLNSLPVDVEYFIEGQQQLAYSSAIRRNKFYYQNNY